MKNKLFLAIMSIAFLGLAACSKSDDNNFGSEYQSCVDFGGGCNWYIFDEFQSSALSRYPTDQQGRLEGAGQQMAGGIVVYNNLDACSGLGQPVTVFGSNQSWEQANRFIPAELPRDGGLVCIDTLALDTSGQDPYQAIAYNYRLDTSLFYFSEFAVYGFTPTQSYYGNNQGTTGNLSNNVITKYLTLSGTGTTTTTNTNTYNSGFRNFIDIKNQARSVNLPILCNTRRGENVANDDCRGRTCQSLRNSFVQTGPNLGICTY